MADWPPRTGLVKVDDHYEIESPLFSGSITLDAALEFANYLRQLVADGLLLADAGFPHDD